MEAYKTSRLEKQRDKAKKPTSDLIEKPIETLQGWSSESHATDLVYSHYEESVQQQIWKNDVESNFQPSREVNYNFQEDLWDHASC